MTPKCRIAITLVICAGLPRSATTASPQSVESHKVATSKVKNYVGQVVTVCAKVVTHDSDHASRSTTLDLEKPYWGNPVRIFISKEARERFLAGRPDPHTTRDCSATIDVVAECDVTAY